MCIDSQRQASLRLLLHVSAAAQIQWAGLVRALPARAPQRDAEGARQVLAVANAHDTSKCVYAQHKLCCGLRACQRVRVDQSIGARWCCC